MPIYTSQDSPEPTEAETSRAIRQALRAGKLLGITDSCTIAAKPFDRSAVRLTIPKDADPAPYEAIIAPHNEERQRVVLFPHPHASASDAPFVK